MKPAYKGKHAATALIFILILILGGFFHDNHLYVLKLSFSGISRSQLDSSLALGTQFLLNNQKPDGNFQYMYDWMQKTYSKKDSQVRQAGALWGLTLIYHDTHDSALVAPLIKGFNFFKSCTRSSDDGRLWIAYPGTYSGRTGTTSLVALSLIDFLRTAPDIDETVKQELFKDLDGYLGFLKSLQRKDGLFYSAYSLSSGRGSGRPSPYFDGETLLALTKAAKYHHRGHLKPSIFKAAEAMYQNHIKEALNKDPDSKTTKGFYQWGSMAYYELATSSWPETSHYGKIVIDLANWMIDVHVTLLRTRNTAYAYEGIIHAYEIARLNNDYKHANKFKIVTSIGLAKLTSWQVGGPMQNRFLRNHPTEDINAIGGIMNHRREPPLRIDVTQHQMHAVILARRYIYKQ